MNRKILLVDDDPAVRRMLLRVLDEEHYAVRAVGSGKEALWIARGEEYHLALFDLNLPEENGSEICRQFMRDHPAIPVIAIIGRPTPLLTALASGVAAHMEKPLDMGKLLSTISDLVGKPKVEECAHANLSPEPRPTTASPAKYRSPAR